MKPLTKIQNGLKSAELSDYDFNHDGKIGLSESIRLLQKMIQ
jgi:hypothetical protein